MPVETTTTELLNERELAGTYNPAKILDDTVRLHVKACGFEVNRNNFQFVRKALERTHKTAYGEEIPAWKSFEGKQVNRNHQARDNGSPADAPIGYIERAYLKEDGVYLDLILWKRTLSDNELSQLRGNKAHVSMEVEYTNPIKTPAGVRTMSDRSVVSFVGIAVLFDGIQPGDQTSGIIACENAKLDTTSGSSTERTIYVTEQISDTPSNNSQGVTVENLTPEQIEQLQSELAEARARAEKAETEKSEAIAAKEAAEVTSQELEAKVHERDEKLAELYAKENEYQALQAQLNVMRDSAFADNLGKCFDMSKLEADDQAFIRSLFSGCYGEADSAPYLCLASKLVEVASAATQLVLDAVKAEDSSEGSETAAAQADAPGAAAGDAAAEAAAEVPAPPTPAPSIAGNKPDTDPKFTINHLR